MPIYEFRCEDCAERFESLVYTGTEAGDCRRCGSTRTVRDLSAAASPMRIVTRRGRG